MLNQAEIDHLKKVPFSIVIQTCYFNNSPVPEKFILIIRINFAMYYY